jgi:2'-5' RNA ligase
MKKLAVNIALVPEESMYKHVLDLNGKLASQGSDLVLGKESIPHITLVQGVVSEPNLDKVYSVLEKAASGYHPINLTVDELFIGPMSKSIWLKIKKTDAIYDFHRHAWEQLKPHLTFDAEHDMFVNPHHIAQEINWVKDFPMKSVMEQYKPHITLGFGKIDVKLPIDFRADKLAIYQMGKYCGCSKEIKSYALK